MAASWERLPLEVWAHLAQRQYLSPKFKHLRHVAAVCKAWRNAIFDVISRHYWLAYYIELRLFPKSFSPYFIRMQFEGMNPEKKRACQVSMWPTACGRTGLRRRNLKKTLKDLIACFERDHYGGSDCRGTDLGEDTELAASGKRCWCVSYGAEDSRIYSTIRFETDLAQNYYNDVKRVSFL